MLRDRDMEDTQVQQRHLLADKVYAKFNMLDTAVVHRVGRHINRGDVVAIGDYGGSQWHTELT